MSTSKILTSSVCINILYTCINIKKKKTFKGMLNNLSTSLDPEKITEVHRRDFKTDKHMSLVV